jgi:hypothetical protein
MYHPVGAAPCACPGGPLAPTSLGNYLADLRGQARSAAHTNTSLHIFRGIAKCECNVVVRGSARKGRDGASPSSTHWGRSMGEAWFKEEDLDHAL